MPATGADGAAGDVVRGTIGSNRLAEDAEFYRWLPRCEKPKPATADAFARVVHQLRLPATPAPQFRGGVRRQGGGHYCGCRSLITSGIEHAKILAPFALLPQKLVVAEGLVDMTTDVQEAC